MDYRLWIKDGDWRKINPNAFQDLDQAVEWARYYGLHVSLNIHRAPGYCINLPQEPKDLWTDPEPQEICASHWGFIAHRYRGIPNNEMSFDLLNEPNGVDNPTYAKVVGILAGAIRAKDSQRLIIADGTDVGNRPVPELIPLRIAQATRGYQPMEISHYLAPWSPGGGQYPKPVWPMEKEGKGWIKNGCGGNLSGRGSNWSRKALVFLWANGGHTTRRLMKWF